METNEHSLWVLEAQQCNERNNDVLSKRCMYKIDQKRYKEMNDKHCKVIRTHGKSKKVIYRQNKYNNLTFHHLIKTTEFKKGEKPL